VSLDVVLFLTAEIVLVVAALAVYLGGAFSTAEKPWAPIALAAIVLAAVALWQFGSKPPAVLLPASAAPCDASPPGPGSAAMRIGARNAPVLADALSAFGRWLALALGAVMVLIAWRPLATGGTPEYLGSLLLIVAGLMLVAVASNLVLLFIGLEMISIPTYILLALGRRDPASQEAAAKYFYLSVLASAILLYGLSFVYGTTGSMHLIEIQNKLGNLANLPDGFESLVRLGMILVVAGLCFRIAAVPFHFYAPDVYQGTIQANAGLLSVLPKAAGLLVMVRLVVLGMPEMGSTAWKVVLAVSILTMTLGNMLALWQENVRRLLAYSSIANAGYMLIGLAVGLAVPYSEPAWNGVGAMLFYLCIYATATLGAFAVLAHLGRQHQQIETVEELAGLGRTHPAMAAAMAVSMFSLAGLPPAAGLWGKLMVFGSALNVGGKGAEDLRPYFIGLAVIGVLNAAVAAYYYLRIISVMYFREPLGLPRAAGGRGSYFAAVVCTLVVLLFGFYPAPLLKECVKAGTTVGASADAGPAAPSGMRQPVAMNPRD
jgi:NADH-quinone oxidoreductase subunit N